MKNGMRLRLSHPQLLTISPNNDLVDKIRGRQRSVLHIGAHFVVSTVNAPPGILYRYGKKRPCKGGSGLENL